MQNGIYIDKVTKEIFYKDEMSIVPDTCLLIEDDALDYYHNNLIFFDKIENIFENITGTITLEKMKSYLKNNIPASDIRALYYSTLKERMDGSPLLLWDNKLYTVDEAVMIYMFYFAEGNTLKSSELQQLIIDAKTYIRSM